MLVQSETVKNSKLCWLAHLAEMAGCMYRIQFSFENWLTSVQIWKYNKYYILIITGRNVCKFAVPTAYQSTDKIYNIWNYVHKYCIEYNPVNWEQSMAPSDNIWTWHNNVYSRGDSVAMVIWSTNCTNDIASFNW